MQIKRIKNETDPKRGEDGYGPAYKSNHTYFCIVHKVDAMTKNTELNLYGDETTCATESFGEQGAGIVGCIVDKSDASKGGQTVLLLDVH